MRNKQPTVTYVALADSFKEADQGKIDVFGVFTQIGVWATPAQRECAVVIGLQNLQKGKTLLSFWLRKEGQKAEHLGNTEISAKSASHIVTLARSVPMWLKEMGAHQIGVALGESIRGGGVFWVPFGVLQREWPDLPKGEALARAIEDPNVLDMVHVTLKCHACESEYVFQKNLDAKAPIEPPAMPFPESGVFKCPKCDTRHFLKDIEGQVTSQLGTRPTGGE